jgi:hypothetical protein
MLLQMQWQGCNAALRNLAEGFYVTMFPQQSCHPSAQAFEAMHPLEIMGVRIKGRGKAAILIAIPPAGVHFRLEAGRALRSHSVHSIR